MSSDVRENPSTEQADRTRRVDATERESRAVVEAAREKGWERPSFARGLYLGRFDLDLVHPHPRADPADDARGDEFLIRMREVCNHIDGARIEREAQIPDEDVKALADVGAFGMKIPREYGGLGLTTSSYGKALMLASSAHPSIGALLSAHQSIGVPEPVKLVGTSEQKEAFLPRCAAGAISAFLLTEPDVGSDPARLATTAIPTADGAAYLLDGVKLWTTNGVVADLLVVIARVPAHDGRKGGITAFVVEGSSPGITVERRNSFMGLKGIENGLTRFHQVRVPAENRLGNEGDGLKIALTTLNAGRLAIPAMCAAAGKWALKIAREWSSERVQWGRPIGEHDAVAEKIAFIAATTYGLESVLELSAQLADAGSKDIRIEAAIAKLWASEMAWKIADELVQIRGGRGYETAESLRARGERAVPAEQVLRDVADQPHLRGLERDHASAHRPGGRRRPPQGGRRARGQGRDVPGQGAGRGGSQWVLREMAAAPRGRPRLRADVVRRVRASRRAPAVRGAVQSQAGAAHVLRHVPLAGEAGVPAGVPRPGRGHRRRAVRHDGRVQPG